MNVANFDLAIGITSSAFNDLLHQYYTNPPKANPFKGDVTKNISSIGNIELTWSVLTSPSLIFSNPSEADWGVALNSSGQTNTAAGNALPKEGLQLLIPKMDAYYSLTSQPKVGGETDNLYVYASVDFSGSDITITPLAIKLDESNFSTWDKGIFNNFFLPQIFNVAQSIVKVIQLPSLSWQGVTLGTPIFNLSEKLLVAAMLQASNPNGIDISGVSWPDNSLFALASSSLVNNLVQNFATTKVGTIKQGSDTYHALGSDLADYNYLVTLSSVQASWAAASPTTVSTQLTLSANVGGDLTAAGMALGLTAGCAASSGEQYMYP